MSEDRESLFATVWFILCSVVFLALIAILDVDAMLASLGECTVASLILPVFIALFALYVIPMVLYDKFATWREAKTTKSSMNNKAGERRD